MRSHQRRHADHGTTHGKLGADRLSPRLSTPRSGGQASAMDAVPERWRARTPPEAITHEVARRGKRSPEGAQED